MKFKKIPIEIEAIQFKRILDESPDWYMQAVTDMEITTYNQGKFNNPTIDCYAIIKTSEGNMRCDENDWIIKEPFDKERKYYPCKEDIFYKTYEKVDK